jgi:hypothetical protein
LNSPGKMHVFTNRERHLAERVLPPARANVLHCTCKFYTHSQQQRPAVCLALRQAAGARQRPARRSAGADHRFRQPPPSSAAREHQPRRLILSFTAPSVLIVRARSHDPPTATGKILNFIQKQLYKRAYKSRWTSTPASEFFHLTPLFEFFDHTGTVYVQSKIAGPVQLKQYTYMICELKNCTSSFLRGLFHFPLAKSFFNAFSRAS